MQIIVLILAKIKIYSSYILYFKIYTKHLDIGTISESSSAVLISADVLRRALTGRGPRDHTPCLSNCISNVWRAGPE